MKLNTNTNETLKFDFFFHKSYFRDRIVKRHTFISSSVNLISIRLFVFILVQIKKYSCLQKYDVGNYSNT